MCPQMDKPFQIGDCDNPSFDLEPSLLFLVLSDLQVPLCSVPMPSWTPRSPVSIIISYGSAELGPLVTSLYLGSLTPGSLQSPFHGDWLGSAPLR